MDGCYDAQNVDAVYHAVINALPKKKENLKNTMIKFTMTKAVKFEVTQ
jgi:ribosomal protein L1